MKRQGNLWPRVVSFDNLLLAYYKARRGKQQRDDVASFSLNIEAELQSLQRELVNGCYQPGTYRQFVIRERKTRLISAAPFRDRVVHHGVMNILEPLLEKRFYYHSYACRPGKGVHRAVDYYQLNSQRYRYVLQLDIARYFPSIRHDVLKAQLQRIIKDKPLLQLLAVIIDASPVLETDCGLPIGNLTSQYFANLYLNNTDHFLCAQPGVKAYLRYVDDLMLFGNSKAELWQLKAELECELLKLGLVLHPQKQQLMRCTERVDVLGYKVSPGRRWLRNDNGYRARRRIKALATAYGEGKESVPSVRARIASWTGHAQHGETRQLRQCILRGIRFQRGPL